MDQIKIGKFIAACRKEQGMTQANLAEKLGLSDKAISKWENGRSMPDTGIMFELCEMLNINVNELLSGEKIMTESYDKRAEENLLEMSKEVEVLTKRVRVLEPMIRLSVAVFVMPLIITAVCYNAIPIVFRVFLVVLGCVITLWVDYMTADITRKIGYYECQECGHRYKPNNRQVLLYQEIILQTPKNKDAKYLRCPQCGKKSWQKKVFEKKYLD